MKKSITKNKILEVVIYFSMLFLFILHFYFISLGLDHYNYYRGISRIGMNFIITSIFTLVFVGLIYLLKKITKPKEENDYEAIYTKVKKIYKKKKWLYIPTIIVSFIFVSLLLLISIQDMFLFFPNHNVEAEENLTNLAILEKINIENDNKLYSGWGKFSEINEYTIIYFGGNVESSANHFTNHLKSNFEYIDYANFVMIDYPGYGLSKDVITEKSFKEMALKVYDYVKDHEYVNPDKIVVMGFSLGSGVAAHVAANRDVHKLILLSPYTSLLDVANDMVPVFYGPLKGLWANEFNTYEIVDDISAKTLVIYTETDNIVAPEQSLKVIERLQNKEVYITDVKVHNQVLYSETVWIKIKDFVMN